MLNFRIQQWDDRLSHLHCLMHRRLIKDLVIIIIQLSSYFFCLGLLWCLIVTSDSDTIRFLSLLLNFPVWPRATLPSKSKATMFYFFNNQTIILWISYKTGSDESPFLASFVSSFFAAWPGAGFSSFLTLSCTQSCKCNTQCIFYDETRLFHATHVSRFTFFLTLLLPMVRSSDELL